MYSAEDLPDSVRHASLPAGFRQTTTEPPGGYGRSVSLLTSGRLALGGRLGAASSGGGGGIPRKPAAAVGPAHQAALALIDRKLDQDGQLALDEYDKISRQGFDEPGACSVAELREHAVLNRYFNVLPFDFNRVRLQGGDGDYINASTLHSKSGESPPWAYIAAQAPLPSTAAHFWAVVWQQRSSAVLMLTREIEAGVRKCHAYMPAAVKGMIVLGDYVVRLESAREVDEDITRRQIVLCHLPSGESRPVEHFQYHAWPDHGVPRTTRPLRALARLLEDSGIHSEGGPAMVHCSAGIGRTGTFCAIDIALRRLRALPPSDTAAASEAVKFKRIVARLRKQRAGMVQTHDQYLFCYQAIKEELEEALLGQEAAGGTGTRPPPPQGLDSSHSRGPSTEDLQQLAASAAVASSPLQHQQQRPLQRCDLPPISSPLARGVGSPPADHSTPAAKYAATNAEIFGASPPRSPGGSIIGALNRRPSGPGGWAGLMGGASTAQDPWAALTRTSQGPQ